MKNKLLIILLAISSNVYSDDYMKCNVEALINEIQVNDNKEKVVLKQSKLNLCTLGSTKLKFNSKGKPYKMECQTKQGNMGYKFEAISSNFRSALMVADIKIKITTKFDNKKYSKELGLLSSHDISHFNEQFILIDLPYQRLSKVLHQEIAAIAISCNGIKSKKHVDSSSRETNLKESLPSNMETKPKTGIKVIPN